MTISTKAKKGLLAGAVLLLVGVGAFALISGSKGTPSTVGVPAAVDQESKKSAQAEPGVHETAAQGKPESHKDGPPINPVDPVRLLKEAQAALEDPGADTFALIQAILPLRQVYSREAVETLSKFLALEDDAVISEAIDTLGVIGLNSEQKSRVVSVLLEKAKSEDFPLRGPALVTAAMMGDPGRTLPVIAQFIAEEGDAWKDAAVRAMGFIATPECVPLVRDVLEKTNEWEILQYAYAVLTKIDSPEAAQLLHEGLYSQDEDRKIQSTRALSQSMNEKHSDALIEAMSTTALPREAMDVIATSPAAPQVFGSVLFDAGTAKEYKLKLLDVLASNSQAAPGSARNSIAEMVQPLLNNPDPAVQAAALNVIGKAAASTDQTPVIAPKLTSADFLVQGAALEAYIQYATPRNWMVLKDLWYDSNQQIRRTAFFFSEPFLSIRDVPDLEKASTESDDAYIKKHSKVIIKYLTPLTPGKGYSSMGISND